MTHDGDIQSEAFGGLSVVGVTIGTNGLHLTPPAVIPAELEFRAGREGLRSMNHRSEKSRPIAGEVGTGNERKNFGETVPGW